MRICSRFARPDHNTQSARKNHGQQSQRIPSSINSCGGHPALSALGRNCGALCNETQVAFATYAPQKRQFENERAAKPAGRCPAARSKNVHQNVHHFLKNTSRMCSMFTAA
jgi:hypothetical protein